MTLEKQGPKIDGMTVLLCQIAELNNTGYYPTAPFEGSGISLAGIVNNPDETAAQSVADYAMEHNVETVAKVAEEGTVTFSELKLGIWLVFCDETEKYSFNPFLVFLPLHKFQGQSLAADIVMLTNLGFQQSCWYGVV